MITVEVLGAAQIAEAFARLPTRVESALVRKMGELESELIDRVRQKLSGEVLNVRSGALRDSIRGNRSTGLIVVVGSFGNPYAAIQEFGGTTSAHEIFPSKASVLAFAAGDGHEVFARIVRHPGSRIPARSYLQSSLDEMEPRIQRGLTDAVEQALEDL